MTTQHLCVVRGSLFRYVEKSGQYDEFGEVGCTIVGSGEKDPVFKLGCYNDTNEYVCTANISPGNEAGANVALQGNYVSFKDEARTTWSLQFESEDEAAEFCASVAVAMYGSAGQPPDSVLVCDVAKGIPGKVALTGSLARVRFMCWVLQTGSKSSLPVLGSKLDGTDQKLFTTTVPANHLSVTEHMKGFEGMLVGMREQGCRFVVIPKGIQRGAGPKVNMCFFVELVRVKLSEQQETGSGGPLVIGAPLTSSPQQPGQHSHLVPGNTAGPAYGSASLVAAAAAAPTCAQPSLAVPNGFDRDQFMLVDRLRDQVFTLTEQLREARQQLQSFGADVRSYEQQRKPKSLLNAQIEHSVHKLLAEVDEQRERLAQRDETLARMEEKNAQLQRTLEKLQGTSNLLHEERKSKATAQDEEKLELDRQIMQTQTHLNRLSNEVEDTVRNVNAVKRLLDQAGSDLKKEKNDLQVALVTFQTDESKLATAKESLREETERCALLESKAGLLASELQTLQDDIQSKNRVIEECQRKTESDVLHYEQLLETERQKAAEELREVRQELLEELGARDRRYQEERQRAAQEAYERGRAQGVDEGTAEAMLAADMQARELTLTIQRNNAEAKAMEGRIRVARDEKVTDEQRLGMEKEAAEEKLAAEVRQNRALEKEIDALTRKRDFVTQKTFDSILRGIQSSKGRISQRMLSSVIACAQAGESDIDFSLQTREELEDGRRDAQEKNEVEAWVRAAVYNQPATMPPLRPSTGATSAALADSRVDGAGETGDDDEFIKIGDVLRIREVSRRVTQPNPAAFLPPPLSPPPSVPTPQQQLPTAMPVVQPATHPQPRQPHTLPVQTSFQQPPNAVSAAAPPLFVARNPFQTQQPSFTDPHGPASNAAPAPRSAAQPTLHTSHPAQPQPVAQAPAAPPGTRADFPPSHIRPLNHFAPPPSLND